MGAGPVSASCGKTASVGFMVHLWFTTNGFINDELIIF